MLSLHYNGDNSYLFIKEEEIIKFKAKDSDIIPYPLCLRNTSTDFDIGHMLNTGLAGYIDDFIVDNQAISNDKILDIHKYLMKKNNVV